MSDIVKNLLESNSKIFTEAVDTLFDTLFIFEAAGPVAVDSHDAVKMLTQKVGENVHKTDTGADIVGLAAQAGLGDNPLPNEEDKIVNAINNDMAKDVTVPDLPTEEDIPNLPTGGGVEEEPIEGFDEEMPEDSNSFGDEPFEDVSETPPPDDFELPDIPMDDAVGEDTDTAI